MIPAENILFASEMLGAVRGIDPETGIALGRHQAVRRRAGLTEADRHQIFETNARRVYPRLAARLAAST